MARCIIISVNSCQPGFWCYNFFLLSLWLYFICIWSLVKFVQYFTIIHYIWKVLISYRLRPDIRHVTCFWHKSPGSEIRIASRYPSRKIGWGYVWTVITFCTIAAIASYFNILRMSRESSFVVNCHRLLVLRSLYAADYQWLGLHYFVSPPHSSTFSDYFQQ